MSSSVEPFGWDEFKPRETSQEGAIFSPAAAVEALLERYRRDLDAAHAAAAEARGEGLEALARQAVFVTHLAAELEGYTPQLQAANLGKVAKHLRLLKDQMMEGLKEAGMEVEVPLGKAYGALGADVQVEGWRHKAEFTAEVVAEVLEPIVRQGTRLVRQGKVIMGAPLAAAPQENGEPGAPKSELGGN